MKIITGIASTTHVDAHYERMAKEALDSMARQLRERFIPALWDHDPDQQIGVILCGKVERLSDGEFALFTVTGIFENEEERSKYPPGASNTVWREYIRFFDGALEEAEKRSADNQNNAATPEEDSLDIADLLEMHLDSTAIWTDGRVYKVKHLIGSTGDLAIHVYPKDHRPAHCHITSRQRSINARFDINTLELIDEKNGSIKQSDVKKIKDFFKHDPTALERLRSEHARMQ